MSKRTINLTDEVYAYMLSASLREPPLLARLREETAGLEGAGMQIAPEQGQFMGWLVKLLGAQRTIEVGVFTGYSALSVALALPPDGRIVACDISESWTRVARRYWEEAGVAQMIDLHLAPAVATLEHLIDAGQATSFDFAFIDADKENYDRYYEACLTLVRAGGVIVVDNVLWGGSVADPSKADTDTLAIRALNEKLRDDTRVDISLLPVADGLMLARKR